MVDQGDVGNFSAIGYDAPASPYFTYTDGGNAGSWTATPTSKGPSSCTGPWSVSSVKEGNGAKHTPNDGGCTTLTPNFKSIGKSGT